MSTQKPVSKLYLEETKSNMLLQREKRRDHKRKGECGIPVSYEISQFPDYSVEAEKVEVTNPDIFCLLGETMRYLLPFGSESSGGWRSFREKGWGQKAKTLGSWSKIGLEFKGIICKNCRFPGLSPDIRALFGENEHGGTGAVGDGRLFLAASK